MDFVAVVDQAIALLRQRGRLTYRTLQLQFQLDAEHLAALKHELIEGQRLAVDERGNVLVWTGGTSSAPPTASPMPAPAAPEPVRVQFGNRTCGSAAREAGTVKINPRPCGEHVGSDPAHR